jgi:hypothetical protein
MKRKALVVGSVTVPGLGWAVFTVVAQQSDNDFDAVAALHAQTMLEEGKKTFRYDTFGSEAFWGDALQLHKASAGEKNGGVGPGVSPKTALSVGLKVDADMLPDALKEQIAAGKVDLDDLATTIALLKLKRCRKTPSMCAISAAVRACCSPRGFRQARRLSTGFSPRSCSPLPPI